MWMRYFVRARSELDLARTQDTETQTPQVFYLFVVETLNTGFNMVMMYQPLVLQSGASCIPTCVFVFFASRLLPPGIPPCSRAHVRGASPPSPLPPVSSPTPIPFPFPPVITTTPCVAQVLISTPTPVLFAWRIQTPTRMTFVPVLIGCFALVAFGLCLSLFLLSSGGETGHGDAYEGRGGGDYCTSKGGAMAGSTGSGSVV
ncbi:hypothetical protein B0H13DRAFT_1922929 [Mycena leptocephala]|nr:hypothetical protein B0H13DRAFT_1922929 [Mycena leptocephala]